MELRKDYISDKWVILAPGRAKRPHQFKEEKISKKELQEAIKKCPFEPGKEKDAPKEIGRISDNKGGWKMRWFPNKFPVVNLEGFSEIKTDNKYFTYGTAFGTHEVLVESPDHSKHLADLSVEDLKLLFNIYSQRIEDLSKIEGIKYVSVFKNYGKGAGASIPHSHSQIISYNEVPSKVRKECKAVSNFYSCPYCEILNIEKDSLRQIWVDDNVVAFCPYASKFHYEVWIFPRRHVKKLSELNESEVTSFVTALSKVLKKLKFIGAEYNYFLNYSPDEHDLHFHLRINPRLAVWAGFEYSTDCVINTITPEEAAKFYNGSLE